MGHRQKEVDAIKASERKEFSRIDELETKLKASEEKLETLVNIVSDCLNKMSSEECYETLREIVEHYEKLNQGDEG